MRQVSDDMDATADPPRLLLSAQEHRDPAQRNKRRLGLALGGGGGRGGAHLGVLAVLEELEVPIDVIVGTSVGAIGVMYAAGLNLHQLEAFMRSTALRKIATADPTGSGLIGVRKREQLTRSLLGERTFADLPIPCAVVTVDLVSGREVVLREGPLVPAMMATTAIPSIFPPVVHEDALLVDGGVVNNLPVDIAEELGAQRVIAVALGEGLANFVLPTAPRNPLGRLSLGRRQFALASRALSVMMDQMTALRLAQHPPALLLRPTIGHIAMLDMTHPEEGRRAGEEAARAAIDEILALRAWRLGVDSA